jgi:uncharacterized membrane protein
MKMFVSLATLLAVAVLVGCESRRGGGLAKEESFKLVVSPFDARIKQGETRMVNVWLNRGKYFQQDVDLAIRGTQGLTVEPMSAKIKAGDKPELPLRVTVPKDASLGEYKIYVTATPRSGESTSIDIAVKVISP